MTHSCLLQETVCGGRPRETTGGWFFGKSICCWCRDLPHQSRHPGKQQQDANNVRVAGVERAVWGAWAWFPCLVLPSLHRWTLLLVPPPSLLSLMPSSFPVAGRSLPNPSSSLPFSFPSFLSKKLHGPIAISFYRGSSRPRDRTRVSSIVGRRFTRAEPPGKPNHLARQAKYKTPAVLPFWVET